MSDAPATPAADDREIERLRDRVTFYESFDRIIQENVTRSGDLLRQAAATRELAEREVAAAQAAAARQMAVEREQRRQTLSSLLGEVTRLQQQIERLGQRLSDELDAIETAAQTPGTELEQAVGTPAEGSPAVAPEPVTATATATAAAPASGAPADAVATAVAPRPIDQPAADAAPIDSAGPHAVTVLVHGVPRAALALSLQRHLARLAPVEGVEAREYAEGILRLQVMTHRPLRFDDLGGWKDGTGLTPVTVLDDVLEVRLPGTESL